LSLAASDMVRRVQISVVGFDEDSCTPAARDAAYRVGKAIGEAGGTVICGGLGGVMEAATKGARDAGGLSVGIVPSEDAAQANEFCDFVIATGLGMSRDFVVAYSGDAMVVVGGGGGTLIETAAAYQASKPIVAVKGTGGVADAWAGRYIDDRRTQMILGASSPEDAVRTAMRELSRRGKSQGKAETKRPPRHARRTS
jgi:uncharacterized protein (TIGR00725 family)